jgi:hypothetical protein
LSKNRICAYIDILGFKGIINKDINGAIQLISDYQETLRIKKIDESMFKEQYEKKEKDMNLKSLFDKSIIDSFEYFIPFSDSAFIIANNADKFVFQISNHLLGSFMLGGYIYDDRHSRNKDDLRQVNNSKRKWYPLLFKGGIAYGDCVPIKIRQIAESKIVEIYNVLGTAVVEAVGLEESIKGPRLFCTTKFYNRISNNDSRRIVVPSEIDNIYEVLWPMPYVMEKGINGYKQLLEIGINLWKHFNHEEFGFYYFKLLELIIHSILEAYKTNKNEFQRAIDVIKDKFRENSIDIRKIGHIVVNYHL